MLSSAELLDRKEDIMRDLLELQAVLKFSVKRQWTEEEERHYYAQLRVMRQPSTHTERTTKQRSSTGSQLQHSMCKYITSNQSVNQSINHHLCLNQRQRLTHIRPPILAFRASGELRTRSRNW